MLEGRLFDEKDHESSTKVLVIDERLARKFWPNRSPIGQRMWQPNTPQDLVQPGQGARWFTVVGVVGYVKVRGLVDTDERVGAYYYPFAQNARSQMTFAVRTAGESTGMVSSKGSAAR